jgi:hypothetical protein
MRSSLMIAGCLLVAVVGTLPAWWVKGHATIAEGATSRLPDSMPAFFRAASKQLGHLSGDPDRWKNRAATHLRAAEAPDHYIDLEDLQGNALPSDRYKAAAMLARLKQSPERTGMLPYAIMENYDRLTCAFADYRHDPKDPAIQAKTIVYAGVLAHYTGDCAMPLHTTRDFDGKKGSDGKLVQKGIHARIDAFPEKNGLTGEEISRGLEARRIADVWAHVIKTIQESHTHVGRCYELDAAGHFERPTPESREFILLRCRVATQLTMDLWYSAWQRSESWPAPY